MKELSKLAMFLGFFEHADDSDCSGVSFRPCISGTTW